MPTVPEDIIDAMADQDQFIECHIKFATSAAQFMKPGFKLIDAF